MPDDANALFVLEDGEYRMLEKYPQTSMGDPENLTQLLRYGYENYPADSYDLILWDHGNGPVIGYGKDKVFDGDGLTLPEIREALEDSPFGGREKLSIVGFDACLMSSAELMCMVADHADYLVASQETEPGFGWNYQFLNELGHMPAKELSSE